jgi:hypoxanthine phosphoribosyltransferase
LFLLYILLQKLNVMDVSPQRARELLQSADEVCSAAEAASATQRLAAEITAALCDAHPLVLCVMRGGVVFAGQLLPLLDFPLALDYVDVTRYNNTTQGSALAFHAMPRTDIRGRVVLLLDDILDEGHTLVAIRGELLKRGAHQVLIAVFSEKDTGRPKPAKADFIGVKLPNRYVFGFGMDIHGYWRNLPAVYALKE